MEKIWQGKSMSGGLTKKVLISGFLIISSLLFLSACGNKEVETEGSQEEKAVVVETTQVEIGDISQISTVNGKIAPQKEVSIMPKMGGKVSEVRFAVGDQVGQGDVLVRLETTELQAQLKQAQAALAMSQANYESAVVNLERMEILFDEGAISKQQLEQAQTMVATGNPDSAAATVQLIEAQLANAVIKSPTGGIVATRSVEVGEMAGQMPMMTIVDIDRVRVETNITEGEVNKLKVGQKVNVFVSALGEEPFSGTIKTISPAADMMTSTFPIAVEIANKDHRLKPGMFAELRLVLENKQGVFLLPKEAVIDSGDQKYVYGIQGDKAIQIEVVTGLEDDEQVEIISGLTENQVVVVSGQSKLQNEAKVKISGGK